MTHLLPIFLILKLGKHLAEVWLGLRNRSYYRDLQRQESAKRTLGISNEDFTKILAYTEDKYRYGLISGWVNLLILLVFIVLGGFTLLETTASSLAASVGGSQLAQGLAFWALFGLVSFLYGLPFDYYMTFKIEDKHGFNRQTRAGFFSDKAKGLAVSVIFGGIFLYTILSVMEAGASWWLWAWGVTSLFGLIMSWLYPTVLAPLFNKFSPLPEGELRDKIYTLAKKIEFRTGGIFVMDASKRSSHGNAYFTGVFGEKRIVLFDTLIESLVPNEIVAVLAHELGHFKLKHVRWALFRSIAVMGVLFYVMSLCKPLTDFYQAFGFADVSNYAALIVFALWYDIVGFVFNPLQAWLSQSNEFAADAFAKDKVGGYEDLAHALVKLQKKNQGMPLTDPLFSRMYYSHPPMLQRLEALKG
jgi:STE24 endopeptidase